MKPGNSPKTKSANVKEIMDSYKQTGRIGNSRPKNATAADKQAVAIAESEARRTDRKKKGGK